MNRCAVVIGVNKTGGDLPVLNAAASGANEFAVWAKRQGIQVTLLTDDNGNHVSLYAVKKAIKNYVDSLTFEQLILFFSGHGILRAPDYELWLLSGAPDDPNDAVNVPGSIWLARNARIPHIVVISDACRSRPNTTRLSQIQGGLVFPNEIPKTPRPAVDVFYATLPGDPALEVSPGKASRNYRGIFTECLLKGLRGDVPEVIVDIGNAHLNETKWVVPSWELKPYLEEEVPAVAASVNIKLKQDPDIRVESHLPNFLSEVPSPLSPPKKSRDERVTDSNKAAFRHIVRSLKVVKYFQGHIQYGSLPSDTRQQAEKSEISRSIEHLLNSKGRESFETRTGFSVVGSIVQRVAVTGSSFDVFQENNAYHVRVHCESDHLQVRSALLQLEGGIGIPLAILPGFIGTIIVENGYVATVNYVPSSQTLKYNEYQCVANEIEKRKAFVAVASRHGSFRIEGEIELNEAARYLRLLKPFDPTLGLYSAYAYAQAGNIKGVESVYNYMIAEPEPVLFDVAMLASLLGHSSNPIGQVKPVTPFCPMLTQGWALIDANETLLPLNVRCLREYLIPALWTTFTREGVEKIWTGIEKGELK